MEINDLNTVHYDNRIGNSDSADRNIISGNGHAGIYIYSSSPAFEWVRNNYIGTDSSGVLARPNGGSGVHLYDSERNHLSDNIISGNASHGIDVSGNSTDISIYRNRIGVNVAGAPLGNVVGIATRSSGTRIADNVIATNVYAGIEVFDSTNGVGIQRNSIYSNGTLGIDLGGIDGVTPNDPDDVDTGPNRLQNFPVLTTATPAGMILGTLNSVPSTSFMVEFFSSPVCDGSGHGEGQTYLGSTTVSTNALGDAAIIYGAGALAPGGAITATARNLATEDTSEFSACISVGASAGPEISVSGLAVPIADGDTSPSLADGTDFGNTTIGAPVTRTFVIGNSGLTTLNLGAGAVSLSGAGCAEFSVTVQPATTVAVGGSTSFQAQYLPTNLGTDVCSVTVANDDSDENPFNLDIRGTAIGVSGPEMAVFGQGVLIVDGDVTPRTVDSTDFGATTVGTPAARAFTIANMGTATLTLGASAVSLSGAGCGEFSVTVQPPVTLAASWSTGFQIQYLPTNLGTDTCSVTVANDDADESPYNFDIQATAAALTPEISISGLGTPIGDGSGVPSLADGTDFGNTTVGFAVTRTFLIQNLGTATLNLGANAVTLSGASCGEFAVILQPPATVAPGGSASFQVRYLPSNVGPDNCMLNVANDDANEGPFNFAIQGAAAADAGANAIPTLSSWGLGLLSGMLAIAFAYGQRRRRR